MPFFNKKSTPKSIGGELEMKMLGKRARIRKKAASDPEQG
jgi:hypothetical protein